MPADCPQTTYPVSHAEAMRLIERLELADAMAHRTVPSAHSWLLLVPALHAVLDRVEALEKGKAHDR